MASRAAETLARLRVCRDAGLPVLPELAADAIEVIEQFLYAAELRDRRDAMIRRAALLLPDPDAKPYTRAGLLLQEARAMNRTWNILRSKPPENELSTPRACLHAARLYAELPGSQRHFYRVLIRDLT
ncbi:MAG: hypothetical protein E6Q88_11685 [Lysobacteraceae bacterium]|nr:MAG: hypothetical protein E6Q88_11685 [Xanthomonadaceae bacterium]